MASSSSSVSRYQRVNAYVSHLPFVDCVEEDSERYLAEIKASLSDAVRRHDLREGATKWLFNLHQYIVLYGLRFDKADHVFFIRVAFEVFTTEHMDPVSLTQVGRVLVALVKKKYLLSREDITLDWKRLFDLYYHWEDSSAAVRTMIKPTSEFKSQV